MSALRRRLASRLISAASSLLPPNLSPWSSAMARELIEIRDDKAALLFALGCLRAAAGLAIVSRLRSAFAAVRDLLFPPDSPHWSLPAMTFRSASPRLLGLTCGAAAAAIGLAYLLAAGAPSRHVLVNLAALVLGTTAFLALGPAARSRLPAAGAVVLSLSLPLLLTAWLGAAVDGASRWVNLGPLSFQVSLILLPAMILLYARRPDSAGTIGMIVAALALALQPDRAMAAALAAGLVVLLAAKPGPLPAVAAAASIFAFGRTLAVPDSLPATAFVDRVLYTAFDVHPLAGAAVVTGAAALVLPAMTGLGRGGEDRAPLLAFGACWAAVVAAAALGNYPTPLVGYGGSAVLGYLLSVALLPALGGEVAAVPASTLPAAQPDSELGDGGLRLAHPVSAVSASG